MSPYTMDRVEPDNLAAVERLLRPRIVVLLLENVILQAFTEINRRFILRRDNARLHVSMLQLETKLLKELELLEQSVSPQRHVRLDTLLGRTVAIRESIDAREDKLTFEIRQLREYLIYLHKI